MSHLCFLEVFFELKLCLATLDMDTLCLNVLWITAQMGIPLLDLGAPLDLTNLPLCLFMTLVVVLILYWFKAVVHHAAWVSNCYTIYHHNLHLFSLEHLYTLIASMVQLWLAADHTSEDIDFMLALPY